MGMPEPENPPVSKPLQTSTMTEETIRLKILGNYVSAEGNE
jgi:hypothetical protein